MVAFPSALQNKPVFGLRNNCGQKEAHPAPCPQLSYLWQSLSFRDQLQLCRALQWHQAAPPLAFWTDCCDFREKAALMTWDGVVFPGLKTHPGPLLTCLCWHASIRVTSVLLPSLGLLFLGMSTAGTNVTENSNPG